MRRRRGRRNSRSERRAFVVEGEVLIGEAVAAGWHVEAEFTAPGADPVTTGPVFELAAGVLDRVASTERPQPNLAVVAMRADDPPLESAEFVVVADRLSDPGNLGTVLRSCEAAGVSVVVLTPGSVDPYNPKVVRASAGALFHVQVATATIDRVRTGGFRLIATSSHRGTVHTAADWSGRIALIVGNEAHGLDETFDADDWVRIDHHGRAESLNVAMATTLLVFEAATSRET